MQLIAERPQANPPVPTRSIVAAASSSTQASSTTGVPTEQTALDPVALTVLAVNCLAPATMRSSSYGKALKVVVPDVRIGEVFRAALDQMGLTRCTDRLIEIVVENGAVAEATPSR